jgi:hypothetical protein
MTAQDIVSRLPISEVYRLLGGSKISRNRGRAFWRDGQGMNVSLSDEKATWYDHAEGVGGGVLDLVVRVLGCNRADALKWLADAAGVALDDQLLDPSVAAERAAVKRDLPEARLWQRAALSLFDDLLINLKAGLFDPTEMRPEFGEIASTERLRDFIAGAPEAVLVGEFRAWRERWPHFTAEMIRSAARRERADRRALQRYLMLSTPKARAAA